MIRSPEAQLRLLFERMTAKDVPGMLELFDDEAIVYDPHYPTPLMQGKPAIERGAKWAMNVLVKPGFQIKHIWLEDGSGVVEVETDHVFKGGQSVQFDQVFRFDFDGDLLVRLYAFTPHGPPGVGGWIAWIIGLWWKLRGH